VNVCIHDEICLVVESFVTGGAQAEFVIVRFCVAFFAGKCLSGGRGGAGDGVSDSSPVHRCVHCSFGGVVL